LQFSDVGFDEKRLGFRSFRAFLEEAERAGYVRLRRAPEGPDVDVLPVSAPAPATATASLQRIRGDLWSAFVDWRAGWSRHYDRETDSVGWLPVVESPDETASVVALRRAVRADGGRYVAIEPLDQDTTVSWMRDFVEDLEPGAARTAIEAALTSPRPIRAFVSAARESGAYERWTLNRQERVRQRIDEWAATNGLEIDLTLERQPIGRPSPREGVSRRLASRGAGVPGASLEDLRDRVCRAVQRMSRGELLRLAIPLEYVLDDDNRR
jgi:hypothetical protein